jgi:hypothetical protein
MGVLKEAPAATLETLIWDYFTLRTEFWWKELFFFIGSTGGVHILLIVGILLREFTWAWLERVRLWLVGAWDAAGVGSTVDAS